MAFIRPGRDYSSQSVAPSFLASNLVAQKETEGAAGFSATVTIGTAGATLLSWVGIRTALFDGPVTGNNGNTHTQQFSQPYGNGFTDYTVRGYYCTNAAGTSNHSVSGTKSSSTAEEVTIALVALSSGTIVSNSVTQQVSAGAGHIFTSGSVTTTSAAMLVAMASGDGNVNATAPTQTWPGDWIVRESVAYGSADAPNGHVPMYIATKSVGVGSHTVDVQVTINEGVTISIYAVQ
jgi:hypothetical protein